MNPTWRMWAAQIAAIVRLELRKNFLGKRGAVLYLLGLMPIVIFTIHSLQMISRGRACDLGQDTHIFAIYYQFFFLRLVVFFGCVAVFMNLFRGEILQKSLHYYFLAPVRREVLLAGKFLSGLAATATVFVASTLFQLLALFWHLDGNALHQYLYQSGGLGHVLAYMSISALACVGYGSVFLAMGMFLRNPIIPAAGVLLWEAIASILPATMQKLTIIHYLQSLAPIAADPPKEAVPLQILLFVSDRSPAILSVAGLLGLAGLILFISARLVRRMEIDYAAE